MLVGMRKVSGMEDAEDLLWELIDDYPEDATRLQMLFELAWHQGYAACAEEQAGEGIW